MLCPNCARRDIGKIGANQFFCQNCCIEFSTYKGKVRIDQVEEDGTLSSLDDLFSINLEQLIG